MRVRIDVSGERELMNDLRALGQVHMVEAAKEVLGSKSKEVLALMKPLTPVAAGDLLASERTSRPTATRSGVISAGVVAGGAAVASALAATGHRANVYAFVQEKGTERIKGRGEVVLQHTTGQSHFMETAAMRVAPTVPEALREAIDRRASAGG